MQQKKTSLFLWWNADRFEKMDLIKFIFLVRNAFFLKEAAFEKYNKMKKVND